MRRQGLTLLEVLVVMAVFSLVLVTVLSFYYWGANTTHYENQKMQIYRTTLQAVDKIVDQVNTSILCYVDQSQLVVIPVGNKAPASRVHPTSTAAPVTVLVQPGAMGSPNQVVWRSGGKSTTILVLQPTQTLTFTSDGNSLTIESDDPQMRFDGPGGPLTQPMAIVRSTELVWPY